MIIQTKYNVGEKVWCSLFGIPIELPIKRIYVKGYENDIRIFYVFDAVDVTDRVYRLPEYMVYSSREECLKK